MRAAAATVQLPLITNYTRRNPLDAKIGTVALPARARPGTLDSRLRAGALIWARGLLRQWSWLLTGSIVLVDQVTKAVQPTGTFIVNTGGAVFVPPAVGDPLWKSHPLGAVTDTVDSALLITAFICADRLSNRLQRVGATTALAGLVSNLADRLGMASLTHPGLPRGSIDWIPLVPHVKYNIADVFVAVGVVIFAGVLARGVVRAIRAAVRRSRRARVGAALAGLVCVAIWSSWWQANRSTATAAQPQQAARSEAAALRVAAQYWTTGKDRLSYLAFNSSRPGSLAAELAGSPHRAGSQRRVGAQARVGDLGLVDREAVVVGRSQAGRGADARNAVGPRAAKLPTVVRRQLNAADSWS